MNKDSSTTDLETEQSLLSAEVLIHEAKIQQLTDENQELRTQRDKLDSVSSDTQTELAGNEEQMKRILSLINATRREVMIFYYAFIINFVVVSLYYSCQAFPRLLQLMK